MVRRGGTQSDLARSFGAWPVPERLPGEAAGPRLKIRKGPWAVLLTLAGPSVTNGVT